MTPLEKGISMTDGLGSQTYSYDQMSRMTSETRTFSGFGLTYGNNYTMAMSYNARLLVTEFEMAGRPSQYGASTVMKTQFSYYADGGLKYAHDVLDERFDRAYSYHHTGMLKEAYSGSESRDYINGTICRIGERTCQVLEN